MSENLQYTEIVLVDIVDTYLMFAASAIAANTVARSAAGSAAPLFTNQMFSALGIGGGGSLIGGVGALLALIPFCFYRYGERIRVRSRFVPTEEPKKGQDEVDEAEKGTRGSTADEESGERSDCAIVPAKEEEEGEHQHRGDRESMDSNPFEYSADEPTPGRHRSEGPRLETHHSRGQ